MKLLSVKDAGAYLCLSEISIRRMIKSGQLAHVKLGRSVRIPQDALERIIRLNTAEGQ